MIMSYKKYESLLYRFALSFLDNQKISFGDAKCLTLQLDLLTGCLHNVVDLAVHVPGVLAIIVGVEGEGVPRTDFDCLVCLISGTSKI